MRRKEKIVHTLKGEEAFIEDLKLRHFSFCASDATNRRSSAVFLVFGFCSVGGCVKGK